MSTFTAYLDDQDLIRIQKERSISFLFYLKTNQGHLALILSKRQVERLTQETIFKPYST